MAVNYNTVDTLNGYIKEITGGSQKDGWTFEAAEYPERSGYELRLYHITKISHPEMVEMLNQHPYEKLGANIRGAFLQIPYVRESLDRKQKEIDELKIELKRLEAYRTYFRMEQIMKHSTSPAESYMTSEGEIK